MARENVRREHGASLYRLLWCHRGVRIAALMLAGLLGPFTGLSDGPNPPVPAWYSGARFRLTLTVDTRQRVCSDSPAAVDLDFPEMLRERQEPGTFDEHTVEVVCLAPPARRVHHRLDRLFGATKATLHFVVPDHTQTNFAVYFDTIQSGRGRAGRFSGLIGDGDRLSEPFGRREIAASHFDCFADLDGDGDLDLFKGGVEPFVYCWENVGRNRFIARGRLASGGEPFQLPCSRAQRSWVTVAFHDLDGDGDLDFIPSFGDGPDTGTFVLYRNTTREHGGQLTFDRAGVLQTASGVPLAGGAQAGGWFPSIAFVKDWDGDGVGPDALVGSNHRCWLYRRFSNSESRAGVSPAHVGEADAPLALSRSQGRRDARPTLPAAPRFADAVAVQAGGRDIESINPRFDAADVDSDGDPDLFAGTQPGAVHWFENVGSRLNPQLRPGRVVAWDGKFLIGDAHSGVTVADFDGDGLVDVVSGRFWERADLDRPDAPRDFGGFWKNTGSRRAPRFTRRMRGAPFTEQFQPCDAIRQNSVRAVDWDSDGFPDLLAGDTDGFIWFFRNPATRAATSAVFAAPVRLQAAGQPLSVAGSGGHARLDVCDWNRDGRKDLVVADGGGTVQSFLNTGRPRKPALAAAQRLAAGGQPIQLGSRSSVLACDWNSDGLTDLVLADDKGYYFSRNDGTENAPRLAPPTVILFGGKPVRYVRPNLGAFVDWDGDGRRDLIGCHFENSIRFYRNVGSGAPGEEPRFADPEGVVILQGESPQMISGADVVDWNGDGDLDLLTGQGHGGSGLRFYERDWLEDERQRAHPKVNVRVLEAK